MSPSRPSSSRRSSSGSSKPYSRCMTPSIDSPVLDGTPNSKWATPAGTPVASVSVPTTPILMPIRGLGLRGSDCDDAENVERPGFPTYSQYMQVEAAYIQSLTPRRQGKALISQSLFDRIWDVLHQPESHVETAQFKFWARKMFTLSKDHRVTLGGDSADNHDTPQEVLLHDNLLVAVQEQLYDLLCYCHGSVAHGGRDKTCALIRKHYTWVPKDLVASFIKACPTCIMKKCGNFDSSSLATRVSERMDEDSKLFRLYGADAGSSAGILWPTLDSPKGPPTSPVIGDDPAEAAQRDAILRARVKSSLDGLGLRRPKLRGLNGCPMVREVSLYKGLPNGWQDRHGDDYPAAYAEFMKTRSDVMSEQGDIGVHPHRKRVPSILPLWGPEHFIHLHQQLETSGVSDIGDVQNLQPTLHPMDSFTPADPAQDDPFQFFFMPQADQLEKEMEKEKQEFVGQIDPRLLQLSAAPPTGICSARLAHESPAAIGPSSIPASTSIKRAGAPPRLQLNFQAEKSFEALMAYRERMDDGQLTPDSPLSTNAEWHYQRPNNPSPPGSESEGSSSEILSPFSPTTTMSGAESALTTPVDECGAGSGGVDAEGKTMSMSIIKGKNRMVEPEEAELSGSIQQL